MKKGIVRLDRGWGMPYLVADVCTRIADTISTVLMRLHLCRSSNFTLQSIVSWWLQHVFAVALIVVLLTALCGVTMGLLAGGFPLLRLADEIAPAIVPCHARTQYSDQPAPGHT